MTFGRPVEVHAYADRIVIRQDGRIVAEHRRSFGRGETVYDPWHYVPVLARKPGALRNGAPFKDWVLPIAVVDTGKLDPGPPVTIATPAALTLRHAPIADCARYGNLRRTI